MLGCREGGKIHFPQSGHKRRRDLGDRTKEIGSGGEEGGGRNG